MKVNLKGGLLINDIVYPFLHLTIVNIKLTNMNTKFSTEKLEQRKRTNEQIK